MKQTNTNMKRVLVLVLLFPTLLAVGGAGGDNACREWGHPEGGKWNVDADCCAGEGNMACSDGYRLEASDVVCWGKEWGWTKAYSYECVPCDAGDASCQGNLEERDPAGLYDGQTHNHDLSYQMTHAIIMKVSAALSMLGSSVILSLIWSQWRTDRKSVDPYQRIMAAYSLYDLLWSFFAYFLGPWMVPAATGWWSAAGNAATCSAQGFFFWFSGMGSVVSTFQGPVSCRRHALSHSASSRRRILRQLCQGMLSLQMLLLVSCGWTVRQFERRIERRLHVFILISALVLASVLLFFQGYNPSCGMCDFPTPFQQVVETGCTEMV